MCIAYNKGMKGSVSFFGFLFFCALALMFQAQTAQAQSGDPFIVTDPVTPEAFGEITDSPACFNVLNTAPYTVYGTIKTEEFIRPDGIKTRHRSNFRLESRHQAEFCTRGPFFEGRKIEITLRSLIPLFTCKTKVTGDLIIRGEKTADGTKTWVECIE